MPKKANKPSLSDFCELVLETKLTEHQKKLLETYTANKPLVYRYYGTALRGIAHFYNLYLKGVIDAKEK